MIEFQQQLLTIPSDLSLIKLDKDPYYRYKMPQLKLNYGKNITVLFNLDQVAKSLNAHPRTILTFYEQKLKTKGSFQVYKKRTQHRLKGFYQPLKLQKLLDKFIIQYVLCKTCRYPELKYFNSGPNQLKSSCNSCGQLQIFYNVQKNRILKFMYDYPLKKTQNDLKQQEDDKIYGNRLLKDEDFVFSQEQSSEQQGDDNE